MGESFNVLQEEVKEAALGLDEAREKMHTARAELLARHEQIAHLAHHDTLTDLPNRTALASRLAETFDRAKADGTSFAVLTIDLDHFKEANDVFGHVVGDELSVRSRAAACRPRRKDASSRASAATNSRSSLTHGRAAGRSRRRWPIACSRRSRRTSRFAASRIPIGLSIGAAIYPEDASDLDDADANADAALYRAKAEGRQTVRVLRPRDGPPPQRALRAAARSALGDRARRACAALSAAGHDRRRCIRLRSPGALAASQTWLGAAKHLHPPRRTEWPDRRDRRMDAARRPAARPPHGRSHCRSASIFLPCNSATGTCRTWFIRSCSKPAWRRTGWSWRSPKAF